MGSRTRIAGAAFILAALVAARIIASPGQPTSAAVVELPAPTGRYPVATTSWRLTDRSRPESFAPASVEFRQVEVVAWYPSTSRRGPTAPYLRETLTEVRTFAKLLGAEFAFDKLDRVRTHAELDGSPAAAPVKFPLLVFSHGYTGVPSSYTALLEDLASHGFAVLSVVHPYEATAATLADDRVVSMNGDGGTFLPEIQNVFAEWSAEDETMATVTRANADAEQRQLLRGYLGGLHRTGLALRRWVDDTRFVLDHLSDLPASTVAGRLATRLDTSRVGALGHSMGGVTSAQFCLEDGRCRAALNFDGIPQYGAMINGSMPRPLLMVYSERPGRAGASDSIYRRAAHPYYRVDVRGTRHLDFSDMVFWGGPLRERPILGSIAPARAVEVTTTIAREYFNQELLGHRSPLLSGTTKLTDVSVRIVSPLATGRPR